MWLIKVKKAFLFFNYYFYSSLIYVYILVLTFKFSGASIPQATQVRGMSNN